MSNYSDPITATGSLITFDAPSGGVFDSLSVPITPTQDLHGYDHPWPGGGGENVLDSNIKFTAGTYHGVNLATSNGYEYTLTNTATEAGTIVTNIIALADAVLLPPGTYYGSAGRYELRDENGTFLKNQYGGVAFTRNEPFYVRRVYIEIINGREYNASYFIGLKKGSSGLASWSPYSNICPITGRTGLSVYVGPTTQQAQATEYAVSFGSTVYAGFADPITGEVKERPQYPSYNGEVLVGPWLSSMDEYAVGVTPTTGAQVVDLGGALATASITPVAIPMREGSNNVWIDTSAVITMIYRLLQVDRQTGATSIGRLAQNLLIANQFGAYSKVIINVTEELYYEAGNDTGRTFELTCPFGTQAMANNILAMLEGFQYQPYMAERAIIDPAAELGDGVTVNGVYGGIFRLSIKAGAVYNADVSSPADEEIDHEYAFIPNAERKIDRRINNLSSELLAQADQISAKVSQTGGNSSSFSWQLLSSGFLLKSGNKTVFQANSSGITVTGQMNATSGFIGDGSNGFLISSRSISNGKSGLSDSNNGVYIGTDGIALGPNFKVDSSGNLTANSGTFTGYVRANMVQSGGDAGYITGGQIGSRAISVGKCSTGINTSLGNADYSADVFSGAVRANYTKANNLFAYGTFDVEGTFLYKGVTVKLITRNVKDSNGNTVTIKYIGSI